MAHKRTKVWACRGEKRRGCGGGHNVEVVHGAHIKSAIADLKKQVSGVARKLDKLEGPKVHHHKRLKGKRK